MADKSSSAHDKRPGFSALVAKMSERLVASADEARRKARQVGQVLDEQARLIDLQDDILEHARGLLSLLAKGRQVLDLLRTRLEQGAAEEPGPTSPPSKSRAKRAAQASTQAGESKAWLLARQAEVKSKQERIASDVLWLHNKAKQIHEQQMLLMEQGSSHIAELEHVELRRVALADEAAAEMVELRDRLRERSLRRAGAWEDELLCADRLVDVLLRRASTPEKRATDHHP